MLLAPNGKPSNLTLDRHRLVRTEYFKKWFGDWESLAKAKLLKDNIRGVYKNAFKWNEQEFLFELAMQANSSDSEKRGAIDVAGKEMVELALKLYPNVKLGDGFFPAVSKIVDENDEPLVLYHGSDNVFDEFDTKFIGLNTSAEMIEHHGRGFYFSKKRISETGYGKHEYAAFLNLRENHVDGIFSEANYFTVNYVVFSPTNIKII